nr:MAG TPA: hypothetical protein [Caudoviricetes sp.]
MRKNEFTVELHSDRNMFTKILDILDKIVEEGKVVDNYYYKVKIPGHILLTIVFKESD